MTEEEDDGGTPPGYARGDYRGTLNIEGVLTAKYADVLRYRDTNAHAYCSSVESFILGCPEDITEKCLVELQRLGLSRSVYKSITPEVQNLYDELFRFAKKELKKANIIFKSGMFGIGHD